MTGRVEVKEEVLMNGNEREFVLRNDLSFQVEGNYPSEIREAAKVEFMTRWQHAYKIRSIGLSDKQTVVILACPLSTAPRTVARPSGWVSRPRR